MGRSGGWKAILGGASTPCFGSTLFSRSEVSLNYSRSRQ